MLNEKDFNKKYHQIKKRGKKKVSVDVIAKSVKAILFSSAILASALSGVKVAKVVKEKIDIERNFDPIRNDAREILHSNTFFQPEQRYDYNDIAKNIEQIEEEKGHLYGQGVLVKILDSVDTRSVAHDKYILEYLNIPADNFLEYANLEGYESTKEMLEHLKEKYYKKEGMKRKWIMK